MKRNQKIPGSYQLLIYHPVERKIEIGRLGKFSFAAGYYLYTGSALNGLMARVNRHLRKEKRLHWHIDYLLEWAQIERVRLFPSEERLECRLANDILSYPGVVVPIPRFGASDCHCAAHLAYLGLSCSILWVNSTGMEAQWIKPQKNMGLLF